MQPPPSSQCLTMEPHTASSVTPQEILVQVNDMDEQVREAVEEGKIWMVMKALGPHIVSRRFFFFFSFEVANPTFCSNLFFKFGAKVQRPNGRRFHADCSCMYLVPSGMTRPSAKTPDSQATCLPPSSLSMPAIRHPLAPPIHSSFASKHTSGLSPRLLPKTRTKGTVSPRPSHWQVLLKVLQTHQGRSRCRG